MFCERFSHFSNLGSLWSAPKSEKAVNNTNEIKIGLMPSLELLHATGIAKSMR